MVDFYSSFYHVGLRFVGPSLGAPSAGLSMWQEWQMPRASGLRGASGSRKYFQDLEYDTIRYDTVDLHALKS